MVSPGLQFVLTAVGVRGHLFLTLSNVVVASGLSLGIFCDAGHVVRGSTHLDSLLDAF